jgi:hypothetical protein
LKQEEIKNKIISILIENFKKDNSYELLPQSNDNIKTSDEGENFMLFSLKLNLTNNNNNINGNMNNQNRQNNNFNY